jgi:pimeloyl-ACP methyl ester carboxylesterase/sugar-specific transcriptional regulator TrmB
LSREPIKEALKNFGLTEKETGIYIFLAKHGVLTAGEISKKYKMLRPHVYRILKSLQKKGVVELTLESPTRFFSVPFEKVLDKNIRIKKEEYVSLEKAKRILLDDWKSLRTKEILPAIGKFVVIEGNKKIYSKISQMIEETRNQFLVISTVKGLWRFEQYGLFDRIYSHQAKSKTRFHLLTELSKKNSKAIQMLKPKLRKGFDLRGKNSISSFATLPRMIIRDKDEALFFITPKSEIFSKGETEVCICTNNESLIQALEGIFREMWEGSTAINKEIHEVKTEKVPFKMLQNATLLTDKYYDEALIQVKKQTKKLPMLAAKIERIEQSMPELVGREKELLKLEEALENALISKGNTILMSGEAGIGKTRLANELISYAKLKNFKVLKYRCTEEFAISLLPFRKTLAELFNISKQDTAKVRLNKINQSIKESTEEYVTMIPLIDKIIIGHPIDVSIGTKKIFDINKDGLKPLFESARELVSLCHLFTLVSENQPIMLLIDDLHLADSYSLNFFKTLSQAIPESRFLLIGIYRKEGLTKISKEIRKPFLDLLLNMKRDELHQDIELERLNREDTSTLINHIIAIDNELLIERIYKETDGNPLFILETLKFLINNKLLKIEENKWQPTRDVDKFEIPPRIYDIIYRRINILKEEERDILDCAAIIGEEFSSNILKSVTKLSRLGLLKKLNRIERNYQLIHSYSRGYRFDHTKIREVLYKEMAPELRKEYHLQIAKEIEEKSKSNLDKVVDQLAYHYYKSGQAQKAIPYLLKAGEKSRKEWAIFENIRYFSQALELMKNDEKWSKKYTETLESLGSLHALTSEHELANKYFQKAIESISDEENKKRIKKKIRHKRIVYNKGIKLVYYIYGEGETTIFLLSWTANTELWIPQVTFFSRIYKVVTMDLRGIGESDKPQGEYTIDKYVDDLKSVIDDLGDEHIIFVGAFIGATIAIKYVINYPGKVTKLILSSFLPEPITARPDFSIDAFETEYENALKSPHQYIKSFWEKLIPDPKLKSVIEWGHKTTQRIPPEIFINSRFNYRKEDIRPLLRRIDIPTLILYGDWKIHPGLKNAKKLENIISGSKVFFFEGLGLCFLNMFEADKFNEILDTFIETGKIKY